MGNRAAAFRALAALFCLLWGAADAQKYICSENDPCESTFCSRQHKEGWYCDLTDGQKPVLCGRCQWMDNEIKCREIGMKPSCGPGQRCVTMIATCVRGAGTVTSPSAMVLGFSALVAIYTARR
jgi:hypothetical protein